MEVIGRGIERNKISGSAEEEKERRGGEGGAGKARKILVPLIPVGTAFFDCDIRFANSTCAIRRLYLCELKTFGLGVFICFLVYILARSIGVNGIHGDIGSH
ncbi:hypothetical protein L873DRAFT_1769279 [Choiromyces venosus 120613-1]|uniref:Uncharacterized protein n=1 Tax=Choiromyces venosus 120613-1 TaxID=1336337 RepID=A0A3N4JK89_9PEZI|nr:hypothetical protein L873DRAFT_1769279 [Choiromyces venosus 120613-1]